MYKLVEGTLAEYFEDVMAFMPEHNKIYQPYSDLPKFELDVEMILRMESFGFFYSSVLLIDNKVKGLIGSCICPNYNYKSACFASSCVIYLNPEVKNKIKYLKKLVAHHEELSIAKGVEYYLMNITPIKDWSSILEKSGYTYSEKTLHKRLI